ncbi:efflux RND transporter permease subunit [Niabella sp. W65]|nr:efflux RND transporter permease subunit [Niabella sp. W65]MCH7368622.1 efflux RND transporter permease subunit [Niabella sp. W65]
MSGPVGIFYRQFSITMATGIILSGIVALTLTPALCAIMLKNHHGKPKRNRWLTGLSMLLISVSIFYRTGICGCLTAW